MKRLAVALVSSALFIALLATTSCSRREAAGGGPSAGTQVTTGAEAAIAWGEIDNDLQAGLRAVGAVPGDDGAVTLEFAVRNTGDKPLRILSLSGRKMFWGDSLPIEVKANGEGLKYRGPLLEPPMPPGRSEFIDLAPGKADTVQAIMFLRHWGLDGSSKAEVRFIFRGITRTEMAFPYDQQTRSWTIVEGLWIGTARSGVVTLPAAAAPAAETPKAQTARRVHVFVSGRVQGVGFRAFTADAAEKRGLTGWVKNLNDGRVEAVVEGPTAKVAELLELLKRGPPVAQVDKLDVTDEKPAGEFKDFEVRYE